MVVGPLPSTAVYVPGRRGRHTNGNGVYIDLYFRHYLAMKVAVLGAFNTGKTSFLEHLVVSWLITGYMYTTSLVY